MGWPIPISSLRFLFLWEGVNKIKLWIHNSHLIVVLIYHYRSSSNGIEWSSILGDFPWALSCKLNMMFTPVIKFDLYRSWAKLEHTRSWAKLEHTRIRHYQPVYNSVYILSILGHVLFLKYLSFYFLQSHKKRVDFKFYLCQIPKFLSHISFPKAIWFWGKHNRSFNYS